MYHALLTRRYLLSKVMPLLAAMGVVLCTTMVLVTWSVMSGFLDMLINTGRTVTGDVVVAWPGPGFAYSDELIADLEKDPGVEAAAPMIQTFGSLSLPAGAPKGVMIRGVEGDSFARVTRFRDILWWQALVTPLRKDTARGDPRLPEGGISAQAWEEIHRNGLELSRTDARTGERVPAIVPGLHVTGLNKRYIEGFYRPMQMQRRLANGDAQFIDGFLPNSNIPASITVFPIDSDGKPYEANTRSFPVANEFQSGVFEFDQTIVLMRLDALQKMLKMNEGLRRRPGVPDAPIPDDDDSFVGGSPPTDLIKDPARVTHVLIKGKGEMKNQRELLTLKGRVETIYDLFAKRHPGDVPTIMEIDIQTWEDQNRTFINAVRHEIGLLLFLFSLVSVTAVFLVLAIFWSMVREKTQDIGVLRALGAGRAGVAWLWVRYGLAIGFVGASIGLGVSYLIVTNINPIHEWLGQTFGLVVWDPSVYYFTNIPNRVAPAHAVLVFVGGVLSCAVGAFVPALRAAMMHPVRALRND